MPISKVILFISNLRKRKFDLAQYPFFVLFSGLFVFYLVNLTQARGICEEGTLNENVPSTNWLVVMSEVILLITD